jgi:CDP-diglyceride synthetase
MSGAAHLRIVIALLVVGGLASLAPYAASLFFNDITPFSPFVWVGGVLIPLAAWLSRGSIIARYLLIVVSIIGVLFWSYVTLIAIKFSWSIAAAPGAIAAVSAYCLWALMYSKDVRAELDRRAGQ